MKNRVSSGNVNAYFEKQNKNNASSYRDSELAGYVTHILEALTTIEVPVDPAMKKSLEQL